MGRILCFLFALLMPVLAQAHALQPGYLELQALGEDSYRVHFARPDVRGQPMEIIARLSEPCSVAEGPVPRFDGRAWISQWLTVCQGGLPGPSASRQPSGLVSMRRTDV